MESELKQEKKTINNFVDFKNIFLNIIQFVYSILNLLFMLKKPAFRVRGHLFFLTFC